MRVLVIGGGFVGAPVATYLAQQGHTVACATASGMQTMEPALAGVSCYGLVIPDDLPRIVDRVQPEVVLHLAGPSGERTCRAHPRQAVQAHVLLAESLADLARRWKPNLRVIYGSSHLVFEGTALSVGIRYEHSTPPTPTSLYAGLKVAGEALFRDVPRALVLRLPHLYSDVVSHDRDGVVEQWLRCAFVGAPLKVNTSAGIDLLHVDDCARLFARLIETPRDGVAHASGEWLTLYAAALKVRAAAAVQLLRTLTLDEFNGPSRVRVVGSNFDGWAPRHDFATEMFRALRRENAHAARV